MPLSLTADRLDTPTVLRSSRRWLALAVLALAQFLVVLDASIVNIALPEMTTLDMTPETPRPDKVAPSWFVAAAWSVPVLMLGDYVAGDVGWYAVVPVAAMLVATLSDRRVRALRWWVGAMAALLAIPFLQDGDSGDGIMRDMHPVNLALFGIAAAVVLVKLYRSHR